MTKRWLWPGVLLATATAVALVAATLVYLRAPVPPGAASGPWPTVSLFGRAGSLGTLGSLSDGPAPATLASGQSFASHAVSGWSFPAGVRAGGAVVAKDGTVMLPTATQSYDPAATTARDLAIATYQPRTDRFALVPITHADTLRASSIGDLLVLGDAVVFTTTANDPAAPALGVLSTSEGGWRVAKQWTLAELGLVPGGLARITRLPDSGDLIATRLNGDIVAIRMAGPDRDGRYTARVMATYTHHSPGFPLSSGYLTADPTRRRPDERFALSLIPHDPKNRNQPPVLQEFRYDAGAGSISAVSAPIIPGDLSEDHIPQGFSVIVYDRRGWLWAARQLGFRGGSLALYTSPRCPYVANVWARPCPPDYDFLQARELPAVTGLVEDATADTVVVVSGAGDLMGVRVGGAVNAPTFEIGDLVDLGRNLLPDVQGSLPTVDPGAFDRDGRLWLAGGQRLDATPTGVLDQWLYAVRIRDLFDPQPADVTDTPGNSTIIQAEYTAIITTHPRPGSSRPTIVDSDAYVTACLDLPENVGCSSDGVPGNGFAINDARYLGKLEGSLTYRIRLRTAGTYQIGFLAGVFDNTPPAQIALVAAGRTYLTPVTPGGYRMSWSADQITLPAGEQTIQIQVPPGYGGWALNSFVLRRS